jgi:uncharacterized protein YodC (DUF2158 family)
MDKIKNYFKTRQKAGIPGMKWGTRRQKTKGADIMSCKKFKVGDKVRVKEGLVGGSHYDGLYFAPGMERYCDKTAVITGKSPTRRYILDDDMEYVYNDAMLEAVLEPASEVAFTKADLKDGMVIEYRNGDRFLVVRDHLLSKDYCDNMNDLGDDLKDIYGFQEDDIVKVYDADYTYVDEFEELFDISNLTLIWERKEGPTHKYKVGDKVKVREDLVHATMYGTHHFVNGMKPWLGKVVTIESHGSKKDYRIKELGGYWWTDEMFEGLVDYEEMTVEQIEKKLGYKVKIVDGE